MSVTFTTTQPFANPDYMRYLFGPLTKNARYKDSTTLDFALAPVDNAFVKLNRGAYIKITSQKYGVFFTGFITNDPEPEYLGHKNRVRKYGLKYQATSDEYILSLKPLGIIPPFLNMTQGKILMNLAERVLPGYFDYTNLQDGPVMAQYVVDPTKKFFDVMQEFCEGSSFVFYGLDKKLYFKPQDDGTMPALVLDGNHQHFTPSKLQIKPATSNSPIINDAIVLGAIEPQDYVHQYFIGTGLDGSFPLVSSVFGADNSVLLDDTFSNSSIDSSKWRVFDIPANLVQVSNGYLNVLGGTGSGYDIRLESLSPIPMDGRMRFTHGDWDFISGNGVVASLWSQTPNLALTGCLYGLRVNGTTINPIVNGSVDSSQSVTIDYNKRYVLRTLVEFEKMHRLDQEYSYIDSTGAVQSYGGDYESDVVTWSTLISEVEPSNGSITNQWTLVNTTTVSTANSTFATYVPVASSNLHCAFTGVTISIPVNATLSAAEKVPFLNLTFSDWFDNITPNGWDDYIGANKETTYQDSGPAGLKLSPDGGICYVKQPADSLLQANTSYTVIARLRKTVGATLGFINFSVQGTGIVDTGFSVNVSSLPDSEYNTFVGRLIGPVGSIPSDAKLRVEGFDLANGTGVYVGTIVILSEWQAQLLGPNEVDAVDGLAPVATIISSNVGADTKNSMLNTPQYNAGQAQLVFFKDSTTRQSTVPPQNQIIRLSYRAAGAALGRAISKDSIRSESTNWLDDGIRSVVRTDLSPRPRNSKECELAAAAIVSENSYQHYEGKYEQWSDYFAAEPVPGQIITFQNLSDLLVSPSEEINSVTSVLESVKPVERWLHTVQFGKPDNARRLLSQISTDKFKFQRSSETAPTGYVDVLSVGTSFASDVTKPEIVGWNDDYLTIDAGQDLKPDEICFEVRYTNEGWGCDDGKNLITRTANRIFQVPRDIRGKVFFIRVAKRTNLKTYSEDLQQGGYSGQPVVNSIKDNPDYAKSVISTVKYSNTGVFTASLPALTGSQFCGSLSLRGPAGKQAIVRFGGGFSETVNLTGFWQRVSVTKTGTPPTTLEIHYPGSGPMDLDVTRVSVESGTLVETAYAKTRGTAYGPVSRYSAVVAVSFPSTFFSSDFIGSAGLIIPTY